MYKTQLNQQTPYDQARALMLSSAYSNMINANMVFPQSVSNANVNVSQPISNTNLVIPPSISKATFQNAYSNIPQNYQGTRFLFKLFFLLDQKTVLLIENL